MTTGPKFDVNRRTVLGGLGAVGLASAGAGLGTTAYFSDTESFEGNTLTAGELDLKVDWQQTYAGPAESPVYGTAGRPWVNAYPDADGDGRQDDIQARWDIADANPEWTDEEVEAAFRAQFADLPDDFEGPLVDLDDVKPGDAGEVTFSFHLFDNPAYVWLGGEILTNAENGQSEPEAGSLGDIGEAAGELLDAIEAVVWYDDGNNVRDDPETIVTEETETTSSAIAVSAADATVVEGSLREVLEALEEGVPLTADPLADSRVCFPNSTTRYLGFAWSLPATVGNAVQTDSLSFSLTYYAEQCRHNDGTVNPFVDAVVGAGDSIQAAVDAASPGDTIAIEAGTYTEQVVVDTPVMLLGAGQDQTTIEAPTSLASSFTRGGDQEYPVVLVTADGAEVRHLTVDGNREADGYHNFQGVAFVDAGGKLVDVEVTNVTDSSFSGTQRGIAIQVYNPSGDSRAVVLRGVDVHDYQKGGIVAEGDGLELTVMDSTVTGAGPTSVTGQNGIQVSDVASLLVRDSLVTGNDYTGSGWAATGVLAYNADVAHLVGNDLIDNMFAFGAQNADAIARGNDFEGGVAGVVNYGGGSVDVRENWWGAADGPSDPYSGGSDPVTGAAADGSGTGVYNARWDPFATSPFTP